jgi:hypothetical protein
VTDLVADIIAGVALVSSVALGVRANRISKRSNGIAIDAATDARRALAIESAKEHRELTPRFDVTWTEPWGQQSDTAQILVKLVGPDGIDRLDEIEIFVRDDQPRTVDHPRFNGPNQADINKHVWGPYKFDPGIDGATADGRRRPAFDLNHGSDTKVQMTRTQSQPWSQHEHSAEQWRKQYEDHPVRLTFVCRRNGDDITWTVPVDVIREHGRVTRSGFES